jgi:DNA-directed RNA polymerase subunit RPC12/RpoP
MIDDRDMISADEAQLLLAKGFEMEEVRNLTGDRLVRIMRNRAIGTVHTLLLIAEALTPEQERRWSRYRDAHLRYMLEKTWMGKEEPILMRGHLVEEILKARNYAFGLQSCTKIDDPDYLCARCMNECSVLSYTEKTVFLRCRSCGDEFSATRKSRGA